MGSSLARLEEHFGQKLVVVQGREGGAEDALVTTAFQLLLMVIQPNRGAFAWPR